MTSTNRFTKFLICTIFTLGILSMLAPVSDLYAQTVCDDPECFDTENFNPDNPDNAPATSEDSTFDEFNSEGVKDLGFEFKPKNFLAFNTLQGFFLAILNIFIVIATPIVVLAIIYAGFLYVTAKGNVDQTKKATTALTYAIIGGILIIGAVALAEVLKGVIDAFLA